MVYITQTTCLACSVHADPTFGPGCLRAPPEVGFAMRSWPLLLPTFSLSPLSLSSFMSFAFDPIRVYSRR